MSHEKLNQQRYYTGQQGISLKAYAELMLQNSSYLKWKIALLLVFLSFFVE